MKPRSILLDIQTFTAYQRLILRGVIRYWQQHRSGWRFASNPWPGTRSKLIHDLKDVDGVISHGPDAHSLKAIRAKGVPVVWIEHDPDSSQYAGHPIINADHAKIAQLAFDHLRDKGLRRFAYSSTNAWDAWPMKPRRVAFEDAVRAAGCEIVQSFAVDKAIAHTHAHPQARKALRKWLASLPRPIGVFCSSATEGWRVIETCNELGIRVPDEIAVIGCDNDEFTCALTHPPLSTIDHGMETAGYEAAALLQRLMDGDPAPRAPVLIPPVCVIPRQSSDTLAIEDANIRDAMRFIREAALRGITPADVVEQVLIGRRRLEMRFNEVVGRTIQQQIMHERIEHARYLLLNTDLSMAEISRRCCFSRISRLSEAFTRVVGDPPSIYRRKARRNVE